MGLQDSSVLVRTDVVKGRRGRRLRRGFASVATSGVVVALSVAGAQWLAAGTGEGSAKARKAEPLRTVAAEAASSLYPGGTGDLSLTVANDNPYDVDLTGVAPNGPATTGVAACDDPGNGVSFAAASGTWLIPRNGKATVVLPGSVSMAESSPDACQDQVFTIPVALTGAQRTGPPAPRLTLSPATFWFGEHEVGTTSPPQRFTVTNLGSSATSFSRSLIGDDFQNFMWAPTTCGQLEPGASCTIDVAARPIKRGNLLVKLRVSTPDQQHEAVLMAKGTQAVLQAGGHSFGSVAVGQSRTMAVQVRNIGDAPSGAVRVDRFTLGSTTPEGTFTMASTTCAAPLAPAATCTVDVRFSPTQVGSFQGTFWVVAVPGTSATGTPGSSVGTGA